MAAVAALPGAQKTASVSGLCSAFQARACSRAPLPTTRTFIPGDAFPGYSHSMVDGGFEETS